MIQMTVGDFKAQFSAVLDMVLQGEEVQVLYGRLKKPVAQFTKIEEKPKKKKRPLGLYEGKVSHGGAFTDQILMKRSFSFHF